MGASDNHKDIRASGYEGIVISLKEHGFFPKKEYRYWETPFSKYGYDGYSLEKAKEASRLENRKYLMADSETTVPDVSYLVEPAAGLWLLALWSLDSVPNFDEFFELYRKEHRFLKNVESETIWNEDVLTSKTYREFYH